MDCRDFCNRYFTQTKAHWREEGEKIPELLAFAVGVRWKGKRFFTVTMKQDGKEVTIWKDWTCCMYQAKSKALDALFEKEGGG